jgi:cob(I)alamin adenosyltransferase
MRISTGQGDCGQTTRVDHTRVWKDDPRVAAAGDLDELGSWLGVIAAHLPPPCGAQQGQLARLQQDLFALGVVVQSGGQWPLSAQTLPCELIDAWANLMEQQLPAAAGFILPGGTQVAAFAHVARTVCRRAERSLAPLLREAVGESAENLQLVCARLNRLSDWLFVLARFVNLAQGVCDTPCGAAERVPVEV